MLQSNFVYCQIPSRSLRSTREVERDERPPRLLLEWDIQEPLLIKGACFTILKLNWNMKVYLSVSIMRWNLQYQRYHDYSETDVHSQLSASRAFNCFPKFKVLDVCFLKSRKYWAGKSKTFASVLRMFPLNSLQLVHHIEWIVKKENRKMQTVTFILHIIESHTLDIPGSVFFDFLALTCKHAHLDTRQHRFCNVCLLLFGSSCNSQIDVFLRAEMYVLGWIISPSATAQHNDSRLLFNVQYRALP